MDDAIIIGGSFAGLTAALYIARARRRVCVIDDGTPRNRFASRSHGFLTRDGSDPLDMLSQAREQLGAYPTARFVKGLATGVSGGIDDFAVTLRSGDVLNSRRIVLAFGVSDVLPDLPGLAERWGKTVLACPYCHGYEFADRQLGVLQSHPMSAMQANLIADWGPVTFFLDGHAPPEGEMMARLASRGVRVEPASVRALEGEGTSLSSILLADGRRLPIDALYVAPRSPLRSGIAEQLGCTIEQGRFGPIITTDAARMTSVAGVYAAGDIARANNALIAAASGAEAGIALHAGLVFEAIGN
ncbi:NAD(P)/FAD-dependent oxidoreductase [Aureimonas sp. AU40]|uniref:NAD(P)/FAD-dependent oxidoreductase n=1 Tax=Aureimonas sp. AU40 TaxID=1637747 RepID=UPI000786726C|nr:NAD(P)/FAD-dependent oxidoreductase [Aureimonas sp. AU40]